MLKLIKLSAVGKSLWLNCTHPVVVCLIISLAFSLLSSVAQSDELDATLRQQLADSGVGPLPIPAVGNRDVIDLGRSLFFDAELSGNRDIACASCHHPSLASGDARSLPAGTGGEGLGPDRSQPADRNVVPRNSPEIFHRGNSEWTSMFWDSRVSQQGQQFSSPAGANLPPDLRNVLAVQAMFPVTSRDEMRGAGR